ncbi:uncharacterized protein LOC107043515 [Diachasma alloeum]|uniref:uncharacterized protein LOC107043515 n=1 Tax=Diachasma alloeum TaxID=454923 RepID=UPI0007384ADA|nr:uncharacterized protein LOC107043515 [Diachasma alloeum]XP_015120536.1 uncharacterized protein LOC107043515 [Diachasma alloeum]
MEADENHSTLRRLMAVALMSAGKMIDGFNVARKLPEQQRNAFRPLLEYLQNSWLNTVGINALSCADDPIMMSNIQLNTKRVFNKHVRGTPSSIWKVMGHIINSVEVMCKDLTRLQLRKKTSKDRFTFSTWDLERPLKRINQIPTRDNLSTIESLRQMGFLLRELESNVVAFPEPIPPNLELVNNNEMHRVNLMANNDEHADVVFYNVGEINPEAFGVQQRRRVRRRIARENVERPAVVPDADFSSDDEYHRSDAGSDGNKRK